MRRLSRRMEVGYRRLEQSAGVISRISAITPIGALSKIDLGLKWQGPYDWWKPHAWELMDDGIAELRFATRLLIDSVLIGAFLQAIAIGQRTKKLKSMFYDEGTLDRLDPFIEPGELRKLLRRRAGHLELDAKAVDKFPRYDVDRLEALKGRGEGDELAFVATKLLERYEKLGPEELLKREAQRPQPNRELCDDLIGQIRIRGKADVGVLKAAHFLLNSHPAFWRVREGITQLLARQQYDPAAINALSEILIGPALNVLDQRREVRLVALESLWQSAANGSEVARRSIAHAARHDPSGKIKERAQLFLDDNPDWVGSSPEDALITADIDEPGNGQ